MPGDGSAALLRLKAGISPRWRPVGPNWTASILSRVWAIAVRMSSVAPCGRVCDSTSFRSSRLLQESGFQAAIENFNGRWQAKVWARFHHESLTALQERSRRYVSAYRQRAAARIEGAPQRRRFPASWHPDLQARPEGVVIFIRRTSESGSVSLLGRTFEADPLWPHRLVRCEVDLSAETIRLHALRRREPNHQPLLRETPYVFPRKTFYE